MAYAITASGGRSSLLPAESKFLEQSSVFLYMTPLRFWFDEILNITSSSSLEDDTLTGIVEQSQVLQHIMRL